jgi:flagellar assembly factor FliW
VDGGWDGQGGRAGAAHAAGGAVLGGVGLDAAHGLLRLGVGRDAAEAVELLAQYLAPSSAWTGSWTFAAGVHLRAFLEVPDAFEAEREGRSLHTPGIVRSAEICSRVALVSADADGAFHWLHSLEDASLALPVANPWLFFDDYVVELSDADTDRVGSGRPDVWVTVRTGSAPSDFSANVRAPILVADGRGHQVINEASHAPVRSPLFAGDAVEAAA